MIVYPSLPSGYTIFCDDVRQEISGKQTFVGVYNAEMYVTELPAVLPKFCCAIVYREPVDAFGHVVIRVLHQVDDNESCVAEIEYDIPESEKQSVDPAEPFMMREAKFVVPISPFMVEGPGSLKVRAFRDDNEIRLGSLKILLAPPVDEVGEDGDL